MLVQWHPGEETEGFAINITPDFFFNNLPETHPLYSHFQSGIDEVLPAFMSQRNLPVTPRMISTLFEILNCTYSGYHKSLFVKAKVIELLALQFEQYEQLPVPDIASAPKQEDIEKMHLARQILIDNIETPLSLKDLAHQIGTNEFNLKKYFKEVFGTTVFGYLHETRMEKSREQLCQDGNKIAEIAQRMGYKHATHFTAAFKKYYGYLPNKIRIVLINLFQITEYLIELGTELIESGGVVEMI
ncbi:AraC family transcriptional regulator [Dyadobacter sp. NIV53]|uniref:helix-turn-helix transcriptional regulator n=1 Tax=Dyadobacter sp. NIV53 TaxID=2861765 RepID=UPI001C87856E|nr:AraC family transcriptional regulator [Dyadobacter sp. NIV53]